MYCSTEFFLAFSLCCLLITTVFYKKNKVIENLIFIFFIAIIINTVVLLNFLGLSDIQLVLMNNYVINSFTLYAKIFILFLAIISMFVFKQINETQEITEFIIIFGFSINAALFFLSSFN